MRAQVGTVPGGIRTVTGVIVVGVTLLALTAVTGLLVRAGLHAWTELTTTASPQVDLVLGFGATCAAAAVCGWLELSTLSCVFQMSRGLEPPRLTPFLVRRLVAVALGAGLAAVAVPAHAHTPPPVGVEAIEPGWHPTGAPLTPGSAGPEELDGDPEPDGSADRAPTPATPVGSGDAFGSWVPQRPGHPSGPVTVTAGDTLWDLAAADLGSQATDAEIAAHWPAWYEANAAVIGADPGLIQPGQELHPPV